MKRTVRHSLRRYHIWLGWIIGLPMLFWTLSGVIMVWKPIEEVRGTDLLSDTAPFELTTAPIAPRVEGRGLRSLTIEPRADGPRWVLRFADGGSRLADTKYNQALRPFRDRAHPCQLSTFLEGGDYRPVEPLSSPTTLRIASSGPKYVLANSKGSILAISSAVSRQGHLPHAAKSQQFRTRCFRSMSRE